MKTPEKIIAKLIDIAIQNVNEDTKPDPFAATAAHAFSAAAAAEFSPESADAAAFVAALQGVCVIIELSKYSAQLADAGTKMHDATRNYHAKANGHAGVYVSDETPTALFFDPIISELDAVTFRRDAKEAYSTTFEDCKSANYRLALNAACTNYPHAYACARAAYTHAVAVAAQYPMGIAREAAFKAAITARLTADLKHEPIEPSFFIQIINSDATHIIGTVLIVAGLLALALGICGLTIIPVATALVSMGLSGASLTIAGSVMATSGTSMLVGRFFSIKKCQHDNLQSYNAVDAMNACI